MSIQNWSDDIILVALEDNHAFERDIAVIVERLSGESHADLVLDLSAVSFFNSADITRLLRLRKVVMDAHQRRIVICGVSGNVLGVFRITALDKTFEFADDVNAAVAALQDKPQE